MAKFTPTEIAALVRAHSHRLHRFFSSSGVPRAEAQDLVQATFEVLLRKLDGTIDDVERYLWGIARTKLLQARTRLKTYEEFHQSHFAASTTTLSQKVDRRLRVSVLLARLDEEERTMFLMRCEGLTIEQIAAATEKGPATVKRRLAEARRHIDAIASETRTPDDAIGVEDVEDSYRHDGA
ncbi:RNA polymerase sigma factor, sigma-70 family [Nannocystis exedens]|uniref:RNA polymerase sigma factor, sigma-70 family n=1 Tax=Nannocystis exedens TaxID=54 RepID=A0A1I2I7R7_9BACT|nr:sigma-70 family RNA polymerase sigma factor [Nannocystis exedens]PCC72977.1 RNA polymerase sigma factor [Nannocystis exedens]SFF38499.1 RNA polymerase sigma factor, sigma-70 family [Nannocystis exedens]